MPERDTAAFYDEARRRLGTLGLSFDRYDWIKPDWDIPYIPEDFARRYPYFQLVPLEMDANLDFRMRVLRLGQQSEDARRELWIMCKRDLLFLINTFFYIEEPRNTEGMIKLPWITPPVQQALFYRIQSIWGKEGFSIEKSRAQAASWSVSAVTVRDLIFSKDAKMLFASAKQDLVDEQQNADTLFAKIRFMLRYLPGWMKPALLDKTLHITAPDLNNNLDGTSTNQDMARGGRRKMLFNDESASQPAGTEIDSAMASVTYCRIDASTPKGASGSFYNRVKRGSNIQKITMHWAFNSLCNQGLYFDESGKPRSPWYDWWCRELNNHPVIIAQELDIDYNASDYMFFVDEKLKELQSRNVRDPVKRGRLIYEVKRGSDHKILAVNVKEFVEDEKGPLEVWCQFKTNGRPVPSAYCLGADVSLGTGASNSAACVKDCIIGEKSAQLVTSRLDPVEFACYTMALGQWFGGHGGEAFLSFERNGPGALFWDTVQRCGYGALYFEKDEETIDQKQKRKAGWWSDTRSKQKALGMYAQTLYEGSFVERSFNAYEEHRMYVVSENGRKVEHVGEYIDDPTGAGDNHGDIVIANMVCEMASRMVAREVPQEDESVPADSWEARNRAYDNEHAKKTAYSY